MSFILTLFGLYVVASVFVCLYVIELTSYMDDEEFNDFMIDEERDAYTINLFNEDIEREREF